MNLVSISGACALLPCLLFAGPNDPVSIPDENLEAVLRSKLSIPEPMPITEADMASLTTLSHWSDSGISNLAGLEHAVNLTWLSLRDNSISNLSELAELSKLTYLELSKNSISDISILSNLTNLEQLRLDDNQISDISALSGLNKLIMLNLSHNSISDINGLSNLETLNYLYLRNNQIVDIDPLASLTELIRLYLEHNQIVVIDPLLDLENLQDLSISWNYIDVIPGSDSYEVIEILNTRLWYNYQPQYSDSDPVEIPNEELRSAILNHLGVWNNEETFTITEDHVASLTRLEITYPTVYDLSGLENFINLKELKIIGSNQISDFTPISHLTELVELTLISNKISDLGFLAGLVKLEYLSLVQNCISDLGPLSNLTQIRVLDIKGNKVNDLTPLKNMSQLEILDVSNNKLHTLNGLPTMPQLNELYAHNNLINDISALSSIDRIINLGLVENLIHDISSLSDIVVDNLILSHNNIRDVSPLATTGGLNDLYLENNFIDFSDGSPSALLMKNWEDSGRFIGDITRWQETQYVWVEGINETVFFEDPNFELLIRQNIKFVVPGPDISPDTPITRRVMARLKRIENGVRADISSIEGIQYAVSLESLNLSHNLIRDLSPLSGLLNLQHLALHNNQIYDIQPLSNLIQLEGLDISKNQIIDISPLAGLTQLKGLIFSTNRVNQIGVLSQLIELESINFIDNYITDLSPLLDLENLTDAQIGHNFLDLTEGSLTKQYFNQLVTRGVDMDYLLVDDQYRMVSNPAEPVVFRDPYLEAEIKSALYLETDTTLLRGDLAKVRDLSLSDSKITNLDGLQYASSLERLGLSEMNLTDISALSGLENLTNLFISKSGLSDISALSSLSSLTNLHLIDNYIEDISPLSELTDLEYLYLNNNFIKDITPLAGLNTLLGLYLNDNFIDLSEGSSNLVTLETLIGHGIYVEITGQYEPVDNPSMRVEFGDAVLEEYVRLERDLFYTEKPVARGDMAKMTVFYPGTNNITDLRGLEHAVNLEELFLYYCEVYDITPLASLTKLRSVNLENNWVYDLEPLRNLTDLEVLELGYNILYNIEPLAGLTGLKRLGLSGNYINNIEPLRNVNSIEELFLDYNELTSIEALRTVTPLLRLILNDNYLDVSSGSLALNTINSVQSNSPNLEYLNYVGQRKPQIGSAEEWADALDQPGWLFIMPPDFTQWFTDYQTTHDAQDAMNSGIIENGESSAMETFTVGPTTVSFWWKVSSQVNADYLNFYVNGILQEQISGNVDWTQVYLPVSGKGVHIISWEYVKDSSTAMGQDKGWVDQVNVNCMADSHWAEVTAENTTGWKRSNKTQEFLKSMGWVYDAYWPWVYVTGMGGTWLWIHPEDKDISGYRAYCYELGGWIYASDQYSYFYNYISKQWEMY